MLKLLLLSLPSALAPATSLGPAGPPQDALAEVSGGNLAFACNSYRQWAKQEGNFAFSPYSISAALAMALHGADGETARQMESVLHLKQATAASGFRQLREALTPKPRGEGRWRAIPYELHFANALWARSGFPYLDSFQQSLKQDFGAHFTDLDFSQTEEARSQINAWVAENTKGKISKLLGPGSLDQETSLVLTNAIYLKANWALRFNNHNTKDRTFHLADGKTVMVPTMKQTSPFAVSTQDGFRLCELNYESNQLSMVILLPDQNLSLAKLEAQLTPENLKTWLKELRFNKVALEVPKFRIQSSLNLGSRLKKAGMPLAFDRRMADFGKLSTAEPQALTEVIHQSFLQVDEDGTEAAAATAILGAPGAAVGSKGPILFRADRPFMFLIRHKASNTVLFLGRVSDPRNQ
ncbi:MAG: serpin family protein [Planctomycetota bacterium]|nr:MAG: serpin family protein [Planctomycetota bacterium]